MNAIFIVLLLTETVKGFNDVVTPDITVGLQVVTGTRESDPEDDIKLKLVSIKDLFKEDLEYIEASDIATNKSTSKSNVLGPRPKLKRVQGLLNGGDSFTPINERVAGSKRGRDNPVTIEIPIEKRVLKNSFPIGRSASSPTSTADRRALSPFPNLFSKSAGPSNTVTLPRISNLKVHGGDEEYDQWFAGILYDGGDLPFEYVDDGGENDLIGRFMPVSNKDVNSLLYDMRILVDSQDPKFLAFLEQLRSYSEYPDDYDFEVEQKSESCKVIVVRCLGNGSTIDPKQGEFDKISLAPQRVLMSPRDLFYYPGMLKLSAFFEHLFDKSRSTDFFNQFVTTFYAGVYGPCRKDLYEIVRVQDIPESVIDDGLIRISVGLDESEQMTADEAFEEIREKRQEFINTDREQLVNKYGKDRLHYKELSPVPKTLEDVLDLTEIILESHETTGAIKAKIYEEKNISAMQSFYLNRFDPLEIKNLLDVFLTKMSGRIDGVSCNCVKRKVKETGAALLYAAYILTAEQDGIDVMIENFEKLLKEADLMVNITDMVDIVHESSIKVSEIKPQ